MLDQAVEAFRARTVPGEPLVIDTYSPGQRALRWRRASKSVMSAVGLRMNDTSGRNNGHFAAFSWEGTRAG